MVPHATTDPPSRDDPASGSGLLGEEDMGKLDGKAALITGGTSGLGKSIAARFLDEGARVAFTGRNDELGAAAQAELSSRGQARFVKAEAAEAGQVRDSVDRALEFLEGLDVLVNNAGVGTSARLLDTPDEDF